MVVGRFAPTPSGRMHLGNMFAFLLAWLGAKAAGGRILLRMEDLDTLRCSEEYADLIRGDLEWLGLEWDAETPKQSSRSEVYQAALDSLTERGLTFPCWCTRGELNIVNAPHASDGHPIYPGTCRGLTEPRPGKAAYRLKVPDEEISFVDGLCGEYRENLARECGDFVLKRADGVFVYQLAVTVDDGETGVTQVARGRDLISSTPRQLYLQRLLGYPAPEYYHLPILTGADGEKLSKRDRALDMGALRRRYSPEELTGRLAFAAGLTDREEAVSPRELIPLFSWDRVTGRETVVCIE